MSWDMAINVPITQIIKTHYNTTCLRKRVATLCLSNCRRACEIESVKIDQEGAGWARVPPGRLLVLIWLKMTKKLDFK
jgi:hypothetical protein